MLVKFMSNQKGGSSKAIDYLLNHRKLEGTARVIKGSEELTRAVIKSIDRKQKTTVGVLSFEEKNIKEEQKHQIIESFEKVLMPTIDKSEYNILWVEHLDKGRLELNFVIPKTNLKTGKSIQPFYFANDWHRIDAWQNQINKEFNLSSPKDLEKVQNFSISHKNPFYKPLKALNEELHRLVRENRLQSRFELLSHIKTMHKEAEIKKSKNFISIKLPGMKKAVRFRGDIYNENFTSLEKLNEMQKEREKAEKNELKNDLHIDLIKRTIYKIYENEKDDEKRRELIQEFFKDLERERVLQRKKIYQLEHIEEQEKSRTGAFIKSITGVAILEILTNAAKAYRISYELEQINKQKNKEIEI